MRELTRLGAASLAALLVAAALGATIAPAGAAGTHDSRAASPIAPVETTTTSASAPPEARLVARFPAANGSTVERTVLSRGDVARVSPPVNDSRTGAWIVAMTLTDDGATRFTDALVDTGFVDHPNRCPPTEGRNDDGYCLLLVVDGDAVSSFDLSPGLAQSVSSGAFADDPRFRLLVEDERDARDVWRGFLDDDRPTTARETTQTTDAAGASDADASTEGDDTEGDDTDGDSSGSTPGFAGTAAISALLAVAVLAWRRR